MHIRTFASITLLACSVLAKPIAHRPVFRRQFSNTSLPVITSSPTFTDRPSTTIVETSPTCVVTSTTTSDETCSDVAAGYGIQLSAFEANSAADSETCQDLLAGYRICVTTSSPSRITTAASAVNDTLTIPMPAFNSSALTLPVSSLSTITTSSATTLTYTIGTGTSTAVRMITVMHTATDVVTYTRTVGYSSYSPLTSTLAFNSTTSSTITSSNSSNANSSSSGSVSTSSSTTASPASSSSVCASTATPPAPTQSGIVAGCTEWYVAVSGDYCSSVAERFDISVDDFVAWNPAVDPSSCPNMLAGDAYCVATCSAPSSTASVYTATATSMTACSSTLTSSPSASTSSLTTIASYTSSAASPTAAGSATDVYRMYTGDGSIADGWPAQSQWVDFDFMFDANTTNMKASCAQLGVPDDSDEEVANMKTAIQDIAASTTVDERVILAVIMQESTGCVRVITTQYSVFNPGPMQSHNGTGTCNTKNAALGLLQTPCPASEIRQMIEDGTEGTSSGDGFEQCLEKQGHTDVSRWYRAARMYDGGGIDTSGDLGKGCCTACYASDIANRLTGWVNAPHGCTL